MLAIVDDQEKMLVLDLIQDLRWLVGVRDLQASGNRRPNQVVLCDASHLDQLNPVWECLNDGPVNLQSQTCLPDPTRTRDCDALMSCDQPPDFRALFFTSQQR